MCPEPYSWNISLILKKFLDFYRSYKHLDALMDYQSETECFGELLLARHQVTRKHDEYCKREEGSHSLLYGASLSGSLGLVPD